MYYRVETEDGDIVGIVTTDDLRRCGRNGNIMLATATTAQFAQCGTKAYRADWMQPYKGPGEVISAEITQIDEETYNSYSAAIEAGEEILRNIDSKETAVEDSSEVGNSDTEESISQTMPTYTDLLNALIALKESNDAAVSALEDVTARLEALEGADK